MRCDVVNLVIALLGWQWWWARHWRMMINEKSATAVKTQRNCACLIPCLFVCLRIITIELNWIDFLREIIIDKTKGRRGKKREKEKKSFPLRDKLKPDRNNNNNNNNINKQNTREPNKNRPSYTHALDNTRSKRRGGKGRTDRGRKLQDGKRARQINSKNRDSHRPTLKKEKKGKNPIGTESEKT